MHCGHAAFGLTLAQNRDQPAGENRFIMRFALPDDMRLPSEGGELFVRPRGRA